MFSGLDRCKSVQKLPRDNRFKRPLSDVGDSGAARLKVLCLFHLETGLCQSVLRNAVYQGFSASFDMALFHNNFHRKHFAPTFHPDRAESNTTKTVPHTSGVSGWRAKSEDADRGIIKSSRRRAKDSGSSTSRYMWLSRIFEFRTRPQACTSERWRPSETGMRKSRWTSGSTGSSASMRASKFSRPYP